MPNKPPKKSTTKIQNRTVAIATGHQLTSLAAEEIIKSGGNVIDASIAAHMAMMATEPCMASMGGAGMAMVSLQGKPTRALDFFCQTPGQVSNKAAEVVPIEVDFGNIKETYYTGHASIAVPGTMAGLWALHEAGASMPMSVLAEQAISYCKEGVVLNTFQQEDLSLLRSIMIQDAEARHLFFEDEDIKPVGSRVKNLSLADSLDYISRSPKSEFYIGEIAKLFFEDHRKEGHGIEKDWKEYKVNWSAPRIINRNNNKILVPNLPSIGGLLLDLFLSRSPPSDSFDKLANSWVDSFLSSRTLRSDVDQLLAHFGFQRKNQLSTRGTSHFSILDDQGNAVSLTSTIGEGAAYYIPQTGVHMNNMLGEESLLPDGIGSWRPGERLDTMTTPALIEDGNNLTIGSIGSAGANRIPFIIGQCLDRIFMGQSVTEAVEAPRIYDDMTCLQVEPGIDFNRKLKVKHKLWENKSLYFGGVQGVWNNEGRLEAMGDTRRGGHGMIV